MEVTVVVVEGALNVTVDVLVTVEVCVDVTGGGVEVTVTVVVGPVTV